LYALSLNIESEARAAANAAFRPEAAAAVVVSTASALSRRAAAAFSAEWGRLGGTVKDSVEFAGGIAKVRQAVDRARADIVFLATDAERARLLRPYLGRNAQVIGTSQVYGGAPREANKAYDLNGMRFFDMPWLHQPDHAATMVFPRPEGHLSADLERLYALGIDAFRVASELAKARTEFQVDGVTGGLSIREGVIERAPLLVEYRDGLAAPLLER
jgi:outer membrane PBP1 activator LpoA protein